MMIYLSKKELIKFIDSSPQTLLLGCLIDGQYFQTSSMVRKLQDSPELFENQSNLSTNG